MDTNALALSSNEVFPSKILLGWMSKFITEDGIEFLTQQNEDGGYFIEWFDLKALEIGARAVVKGGKWTGKFLRRMVGFEDGKGNFIEHGVLQECAMMKLLR